MDSDWNQYIAKIPHAHLLQTSQWAQIKESIGWEVNFQKWYPDESKQRAAAMILRRSLPIRGFSKKFQIYYVPKGPLLTTWEDEEGRTSVLSDLEQIARRTNAIFIKIDPDIPLSFGFPGSQDDCTNPLGQKIVSQLQSRGWLFSQDQIQFRNTIVLDLNLDLDVLLSQMKQKTRYNIRLASRKGVSVRNGSESDLPLLMKMYAETSIRDGFVIRGPDYYLNTWKVFLESGLLDILVAEVQGETVAGLLLFHFAETAWYMYGMSFGIHREKMPTYLLQWEAIKRAKSLGCKRYDFWGAPDHFDENDSMWGVYKFKEGLGGRITRHIGAWDYPVHLFWYQMYTRILPRLLDINRILGNKRTRQSLE